MAETICGVYIIINTITGDFYIGSSKNIKERWRNHKKPSVHKKYPNNPMYLDMQNYGVDKFELQILAEVEADKLKEIEQQFIETLKPTYNNYRAKGLDIERYKKTQKEYMKEYNKTDKRKKAQNKYENKLCFYNGQTLTISALSMRFRKQGIDHPNVEAKKYLVL